MTITSYDYGSYGSLQADVTLSDGTKLNADVRPEVAAISGQSNALTVPPRALRYVPISRISGARVTQRHSQVLRHQCCCALHGAHTPALKNNLTTHGWDK